MISRNRLLNSLFLISLAWINVATTTPLNSMSDAEIPDVEECSFIDAYYVNCSWRRIPGNAETTYRLRRMSPSYYPEENDQKFCEGTTLHIQDDGITVESCGFRADMFQRFTLWIESFPKCKGARCSPSQKGKSIRFEASRDNVKLMTVSPSSLKVDAEGRRLSWLPPDKEHSMLEFVFLKRNLLYKVEFKESTEKDIEWKNLYIGNETGIHLPSFHSGISYDFRVSASLEPLKNIAEKNFKTGKSERKWTRPSNVLIYVFPKSSIGTDGEKREILDNEIDISETKTEAIDTFNSNDVERHMIIVAIVTPTVAIVIVLTIILVYIIYWKGYCCFELKFIRPKAFIELVDKSNDDSLINHHTLLSSPGARSFMEDIYPVSISEDSDWSDEKRNKSENSFAQRLTVMEPVADDDSRRRLISSYPGMDETLIVEGVVHRTDDDVTEDFTIEPKAKDKFPSKKSLDEESIEYMKFMDKSDSFSLPNYVMTADQDHQRCCTEYVTDDVDSTLLNVVSYVTGVASRDYEDYEKEQQWKKFIAKPPHDDDISDDIPDYVIQESECYEDFSKTMKSFFSTLADAGSKANIINIDEADREETKIEMDSECGASCLIDVVDYKDVELQHSGDTKYLPCASSIQNDNRQLDHRKKKTRKAEDAPGTSATLSRSGSGSLPSIDSGYSPDISDGPRLSPNDETDIASYKLVIPPEYLESSECETSDDDEVEYMTYVVT